MQACVQYVVFQLPNNFTRVDYLLNGIKKSNTWLQVTIANVYDDVGTTAAPRKLSNFESAVTYLLSKDSVVKRRKINNDPVTVDI